MNYSIDGKTCQLCGATLIKGYDHGCEPKKPDIGKLNPTTVEKGKQ